jgi:hypothetical protein
MGAELQALQLATAMTQNIDLGIQKALVCSSRQKVIIKKVLPLTAPFISTDRVT